MKTVWKFELTPLRSDEVEVKMPGGARLLGAGVQDQRFFVWAVVDPEVPVIVRKFVIHGTGHPMIPEAAFASLVDIVFMGPLVFHVFDLGEKPKDG